MIGSGTKLTPTMLGALWALLFLALLLPAAAFAEGGKSIATAPSVVYGQQEFGNTATGAEWHCGFFSGTYRDQFWLVNVTAGDLLTVNWGGVNATTLRLYPVGTTDYTVFGESTRTAAEEDLNGNNKSQLQYNVPVSGVMPLEFAVCDEWGEEHEEPGPYDFTATAQHGLSVNLLPRPHIRTNSVIYGSAALTSGAPVPNGKTFTLTVSWSNGSASYSALSSEGSLAFPLVIPEEVAGQTITLALSRPADTEYLAPKTAELKVKVAKPRVAPTPLPRHRHHRHCPHGFKKRHVRGHVRCVRRRGHRSYSYASASGNLKQRCGSTKNIFKQPQILDNVVDSPGKRAQSIFINLSFGEVDQTCDGHFARQASVLPQLIRHGHIINENPTRMQLRLGNAPTPDGIGILDFNSVNQPQRYWHPGDKARFVLRIVERSNATKKVVKAVTKIKPIKVKR